MTHITADDPPFLIIQGTSDATVPLFQSQRLVEQLQAGGVPAELIVVEGGRARHSGRRLKRVGWFSGDFTAHPGLSAAAYRLSGGPGAAAAVNIFKVDKPI